MKSALESVNAEKNLSSDVSEIIHKALNSWESYGTGN
jgi:hypothetical protein